MDHDRLFKQLLTTFFFEFVALFLPEVDFADKDNPVASALMAKMRIDPRDRPKVKLACMRMMLRLTLNDAQRALIKEFVNSYLRLNAFERVEYEQEVATLAPPEKEQVMAVMNEWAEAALERGMQRGLEQGREQGLMPFLGVLQRTVGNLPADVEEQVRKLSEAQLENWPTQRLLSLHSRTSRRGWPGRPDSDKNNRRLRSRSWQ